MIALNANIVSELIKPAPATAVVEWIARQQPDGLALSSITLGEIDFGARCHQQPHKRAELLAWCDQLQATMFRDRILPFDADCVRVWGQLLQEARARGRAVEWRDSQIAATVIAHQASLATRNVRHFAGLGIDLIDPFSMGGR